MKKILLVRLSSLGDVLHTFPAVSDLRRAAPDAALDWVVEEAYAALVRMHPGVRRALPVELRRLRGEFLRPSAWREFAAFRASLREHAYDASLARGPLHGYGSVTAREKLSARFYDFAHEIPRAEQSVQRYRSLLGRALGYVPEGAIDYGIVPPPAPAFAPQERYCVLLHSTARAKKLWREEAWVEVGRALEARRLVCVLPWGAAAERRRAERLAASLARAVVPPRMSLEDAAGLIGRASAVVGLDTGLTHLAVALRIPVVGIYCGSEPSRTGPLGTGPIVVRGGPGGSPTAAEVLDGLGAIAPSLA